MAGTVVGPIGTLGNVVPTLTVGGRVFTDLDNLKMLVGNIDRGNGVATLRDVNSSSGYQVPGGKTFKVAAVRIVYSGYISGIEIGYGDNDVGMGSVSQPTNVVFPGGSQNNFAIVGKDTNSQYEAPFQIDIPTGKYPCFGSLATGSSAQASVIVYGYEV